MWNSLPASQEQFVQLGQLLQEECAGHLTNSPTDKGSATVMVSKQDYLDKVMSHLRNEKYYLKLDEELTSRNAEEITFPYRNDKQTSY